MCFTDSVLHNTLRTKWLSIDILILHIVKATDEESSKFCTLPRQRRGQSSHQAFAIKNICFEKGPGNRSLGFTVVGGKDSPKGSIGIYVKSIFPNGQAIGLLKEGTFVRLLDQKFLLKNSLVTLYILYVQCD